MQVVALPGQQAAGAYLQAAGAYGLVRAAWHAGTMGVWNAWSWNRYRSTAWDVQVPCFLMCSRGRPTWKWKEAPHAGGYGIRLLTPCKNEQVGSLARAAGC